MAALMTTAGILAGTTSAQASSTTPRIELGLALAPSWQSAAQSLVHRDRGLGLGHSDLSIDALFANGLRGRVGLAAQSDHARVEAGIEEAYLESPGLGGGFQARAGRFMSQLGYLNEQHAHADDFVTRPLLHRALLGGHYFDDGFRFNWIAPTALYWRVGVELFRGDRLPATASTHTVGAWTIGTRVGGDLGNNASWQLGAATLRHRNGALGAALDPHAEAHGDHGEGDEDTHAVEAHSHSAAFFGRKLDWVDWVWKWAPDGNARHRQLRLSAEYARARAPGSNDHSSGQHAASYWAIAYRFMQQWEIALRTDSLSVSVLHGSESERARLTERSLSVAWKPSHSRALRLQYSWQQDRLGFAEISEIAPRNALHLQFVQSFGAHGAHSF
jgi:hypothetical protein